MTKSFKNKRAKFKPGQQRLFIKNCLKKLNLSNNQAASFLKISVRTLTDWKREKFLIPLVIIKMLSQKTGVRLPKNLITVNQFWYAKKGGHLGGLAVYKKYGVIGGDRNYRLTRWRSWWKKEGQFKPHPILNAPLPFKKPEKSNQLSEFVGIMLGDGGISKYQLTISLNHKDDKMYGIFVSKMIKKLFNVNPAKYHDIKNSVNDFVVSRSELVKFCVEKLGLKIGNKIKQQIDIPNWIKNKKNFKKFCLRGLFDTDGCLVIHKYKVNGKLYIYKKMHFSSASPPLISSIIKSLKEFDFKPRLSHNGRNVWIDDQKEVARYLNVIGSSNPKHWKRFWRRRIVV